jgi:cell division control protein 6
MVSGEEQILDEIFNNFLLSKRIFEHRTVLRHDYLPKTLPHREEQITQLGKILAPTLQGYRSSNVLIYGKTGTGKTAVVKHVLDQLLKKSKALKNPLRISYVNCRLSDTEYRVLLKLCSDMDLKIPFTGLALGEALERFKLKLDAGETLLITVLDEIDSLVRAHGDALLYHLTRINATLETSQLSIIGISNDLKFKDRLDPRVTSSLSEEESVFHPYTATELRDILKRRAETAFCKDVLTPGALNLCAALAATEHGDARRALDMLRVAGELAERENLCCVSDELVRNAQKKIEQDRIDVVMKTLPAHSKLILYSVYLKRRARKGGITGTIYDLYRSLCDRIGFDPLTQRRVSSLISELDMLGLVTAQLVNRGRYGRTKKIRLGVPARIIKRACAEDPWLNKLLSDEERVSVRL